MKIVFLDIDGVLNSAAWRKHLIKEGRYESNALDPAAVACLNRIAAATGAHIVVSSTWRLMHPFEWMSHHLMASGVEARVLGYTPDSHPRMHRGWEISEWLRVYQVMYDMLDVEPVDGFAILDDDCDMAHLVEYHIHTSGMRGLTMDDAERAIEVLNRDVSDMHFPYASSEFGWYDLTRSDARKWTDMEHWARRYHELNVRLDRATDATRVKRQAAVDYHNRRLFTHMGGR